MHPMAWYTWIFPCYWEYIRVHTHSNCTEVENTHVSQMNEHSLPTAQPKHIITGNGKAMMVHCLISWPPPPTKVNILHTCSRHLPSSFSSPYDALKFGTRAGHVEHGGGALHMGVELLSIWRWSSYAYGGGALHMGVELLHMGVESFTWGEAYSHGVKLIHMGWSSYAYNGWAFASPHNMWMWYIGGIGSFTSTSLKPWQIRSVEHWCSS